MYAIQRHIASASQVPLFIDCGKNFSVARISASGDSHWLPVSGVSQWVCGPRVSSACYVAFIGVVLVHTICCGVRSEQLLVCGQAYACMCAFACRSASAQLLIGLRSTAYWARLSLRAM